MSFQKNFCYLCNQFFLLEIFALVLICKQSGYKNVCIELSLGNKTRKFPDYVQPVAYALLCCV